MAKKTAWLALAELEFRFGAGATPIRGGDESEEVCQAFYELLPNRGHKAGGKFQPAPANALEGLAFENSEGGS